MTTPIACALGALVGLTAAILNDRRRTRAVRATR